MSERMDEAVFRVLYWRQVDDGEDAQAVANEAARARASEDAKDKEIERLKADNAGLLALMVSAERTWSKSHNLDDAAHHASMMALRAALTTQLHYGTDILEELTRLRSRVAALAHG